MSGSGGGSYTPPQFTKFDCENSKIITNISSINLMVLNKHKIGDILEVLIGENNALVLEDGDGEILGAILHVNTSEIINCINNGAEYESEILNINSPVCKVEVRRK